MLGKRSKPDGATNQSEDLNPVSQVDFIELDQIKTSKPLSRTSHGESQPPLDSLPLSVRERYQTHKKRDDKHKTKDNEEERKRESTTSAASEGINKKEPSKWSTLYGEASKQIGKLIDKQSERLQAKEDAVSAVANSKQDKKGKQQQAQRNKDAPEKSGGSQTPQQSFKKEKKPKYYLGSSIGGDKKFSAF